ncbi:hypothetical protein LTR04_003338 [Oleoguttula sp. CCFEE 6159]|nr:hypothetical protein LTR04_003338 [Oleoguttula sp. CCFEE 6159]
MPRTNSSHGLIDLTREDTTPSAPSTSNTSKRPGDPHPESSSSTKRTKLSNGSSPKNSKRIEEVDLVEAEERLAARLEKERAEQVKAQQEASKAPRTFSRQTCIICMESYTNVTAAICGHIFCHECLIQAIAVADRDRSGTGQKGTCPVCRRPLDRKKATNFIPIQLMKKSKYRSRRASASSAQVSPSQGVSRPRISE